MPVPGLRARSLVVLAASVVCLLFSMGGSTGAQGVAGLNRIGHIVVLYEENHSFDNYFGSIPGANGIAQAPAAAKTQVNRDGSPMQQLRILDTGTKKPD